MKPFRIALVLTALVLVLEPVSVPAETEAGHARFTPWSGYWWPNKKGGLSKPLTKYSRYVGNTQALNWQRKEHPAATAGGWEGNCHAWSAAAVMEMEPNRLRRVRGIQGETLLLTIGDQKGLLAAAHTKDITNSYGTRSETNDPTKPEYIDLTPDQLWRYLKWYIKQQGLPLVMDLEPGKQVWNYPVYAYRIRYNRTGGNDYRGLITIWYAEDNVPPDYVGTKIGTRTYHCTFKMRGGSVVMGSGHWIGPSIRNHPDFAWSPYVVKSENPSIDYGKIRQMLGLSSHHRGIDDGETPLPDPMTDPSMPPPPLSVANSREGPLAEDPTGRLAPGTVTLTPDELIALLANKRLEVPSARPGQRPPRILQGGQHLQDRRPVGEAGVPLLAAPGQDRPPRGPVPHAWSGQPYPFRRKESRIPRPQGHLQIPLRQRRGKPRPRPGHEQAAQFHGAGSLGRRRAGQKGQTGTSLLPEPAARERIPDLSQPERAAGRKQTGPGGPGSGRRSEGGPW